MHCFFFSSKMSKHLIQSLNVSRALLLKFIGSISPYSCWCSVQYSTRICFAICLCLQNVCVCFGVCKKIITNALCFGIVNGRIWSWFLLHIVGPVQLKHAYHDICGGCVFFKPIQMAQFFACMSYYTVVHGFVCVSVCLFVCIYAFVSTI